MLTIHPRIWLIAPLVVAFGASAGETALAKTAHRYSGTLMSAPLSTANGYPNPGGTALLAGSLKASAPFGNGAVIDQLTITGKPAPNVFAFKGREVDFFAEGTGRNTFTGTSTVQADGSQKVAGTGRFTGGTGRYSGATGRYRFSGKVPSGSSVLTLRSSGSIAY